MGHGEQGGHGQKWMWQVWSQDSKIDHISMNIWNGLIFCMLMQI